MPSHAVVIAGGGPTGLMLAGELALAKIDVAIVERRASQALDGSRAGGLLPRSIEVLDQRGIAERFVEQGTQYKAVHFGIPLDISDAPTQHGFTLGLWQEKIERTLADWVGELGVPIYRSREVTGFAQDAAGVDVAVSSGEPLRAQYLVGCDGGRSLIRKLAGIEFAGWDASTSYLLAEAEMAVEPPWGFRRDERGNHGIGKLDGGPRVRLVLENVSEREDPTIEDLRAGLVAIYGTDYGVHSATWITRFTDMARQAVAYRAGRVLVAGDAAHVHSPMGGQGLNTGVQDAVNLGWKLAQVVRGTSPESLLDSYHAERHPVAARVLRATMAQTALRRTDERNKALHDHVAELLAMDEPRRRYAAMQAGLDIRYDLGAQRVYALLHEARPVLLEVSGAALELAGWTERVKRVRAEYTGAWELPVLGAVPAPAAVLIRPDGHVAWVGDGTDQGLRDALATWFGP